MGPCIAPHQVSKGIVAVAVPQVLTAACLHVIAFEIQPGFIVISLANSQGRKRFLNPPTM